MKNKKLMLIERSKKSRKNQTDAENKLWYHLRNRRLMNYKFKRQVLICHYIVDFVCLEKSLIVEVDGGQHDIQASYDDQRDSELKRCGFEVIRFWNNEVLVGIESVL
ncbi:MAG: DUF559 domain-containing protein [Gammaproteobacteria bacterium]